MKAAQWIRYRLEDMNLIKNYYGNAYSFFERMNLCRLKMRYQKKYGFAHLEFFCLHLAEKTEEEVRRFYPRKRMANLYYAINGDQVRAECLDKYVTYVKLKQYYMREVVAYNPHPNVFVADYYAGYPWEKEILAFLSKHSRFIIKPLDGNCGVGVRLYNNLIDSPRQLLERFINDYPNGFVLEGTIIQSESLARYHPRSVNTVRINTVNIDGRIELKYPFFRMGRGNAIVDNGGSGGIFSAIDITSGRLLAGADEDGVRYTVHPESLIPISGDGEQIPMWEDLKKTAIDIAMELPDLKFSGLDLALTDKGWCLVEVNCFPYILYQIATQEGIAEYMQGLERHFKMHLS